MAVHRRRRGARLRRQPGRRDRDAAAAGARPGRTEPADPVHRNFGHGRRRRDPSAVTRFAANLFGQPFEWVDGDPDRQDLVIATRVEAPAGPVLGAAVGGRLPGARRRMPIRLPRARALLTRLVWRADGATAATHLSHEQSLADSAVDAGHRPTAFARRSAATVFGDDAEAGAGLAAMVDLGSSLRAERRHHPAVGALPPLPAGHRGRLHLPVRRRARTSSWPGTRTARTATRRYSRSARASAAAPCTSLGHADTRRRRPPAPAAQGRQQGHLARARRAGCASPTRTKRPSPTTASRSTATTRSCAPACGAHRDKPTRPVPGVRLRRPAPGPQAQAARRGDRRLPGLRRPRVQARFASSRPDRTRAAPSSPPSLYQNLPPSSDAHDGQRPGRGAQAPGLQRQPAGGGVLRALPGGLLRSAPAPSADRPGPAGRARRRGAGRDRGRRLQDPRGRHARSSTSPAE